MGVGTSREARPARRVTWRLRERFLRRPDLSTTCLGEQMALAKQVVLGLSPFTTALDALSV